MKKWKALWMRKFIKKNFQVVNWRINKSKILKYLSKILKYVR